MGDFPDECVQGLLAEVGHKWWVQDKSKSLVRGRVVYSFVHHVDMVPLKLVVEGRADANDHRTARITVAEGSINDRGSMQQLPVAALPHRSGEHYIVHRAKRRVALVVGVGGPEVTKDLTRGKPRWQTAPTIQVAPYYGATSDGGKRSGFSETLLARVRLAQYPQFIWDRVPVRGASESLLRLDHILPIGNHQRSFQATEWRLSDEAMAVVDEWMFWCLTGKLNTEGDLLLYRDFLQSL